VPPRPAEAQIDGIRGLARTLACLGPGLVALRLSHLATRGTDPRVAELALPRLTRLDFLACSGDLLAAFDGVALSASRLRRLEANAGPGAGCRGGEGMKGAAIVRWTRLMAGLRWWEVQEGCCAPCL
jgi:hypothetical protein